MNQKQPRNLPAYRIHLNDGCDYVTSMAEGVTLEQARAYFIGQDFTEENFATGAETVRRVVNVTAA